MPQLGDLSPRERHQRRIRPLTERLAEDVDRYSVHWADWRNGTSFSCGSYELGEETATDRGRIVTDIIDEQWDLNTLEAVRCGNEALGTYRNVTRDIADDVLQRCIDEQISLSSRLRNWLHTHVGIRATEDAVEEYPYLDGDYYGGRI